MGVLSILYIEGCNVRFSAHKIYTTVVFFFAYIRTEEKKIKTLFKDEVFKQVLGGCCCRDGLGVLCVCIYGNS